jgi:hypothetical protein
MKMPGFLAEESLFEKDRKYRVAFGTNHAMSREIRPASDGPYTTLPGPMEGWKCHMEFDPEDPLPQPRPGLRAQVPMARPPTLLASRS